MPKPDHEDDATAIPPKLAALWDRIEPEGRAAKLAAGSGLHAERTWKMLRLREFVAQGRVAEAELDRALAALRSHREPDWPAEILEAFAASRAPQTASPNRIARLERRLAEEEAAFVTLGLPASESRILAPYARYALDWMPFVPILFDPPPNVVAVLGERYPERSEPLPEPTDADVADALAELDEARPGLHREMVQSGFDPQTAQEILDATIDSAARLAVALQMAAEKGDDARLARPSPAWESAINIGILVRTLAEPTPEQVSGTERYLLGRLVAGNSAKRAIEAVNEAAPSIRRNRTAVIGASGGRAGRGKAKTPHSELIHRAAAQAGTLSLRAVLDVLRDEDEVEALAMARPSVPIVAVRVDEAICRVFFEYEDRGDVARTFDAIESAVRRLRHATDG